VVRHSTFERYYKRVVAKHDAAMQKVIRNQVNYGIEQYKNKGNYASLPTDELEAELKTIFVDGAYVWGKFIQKSLPKDVQKSEQQDTFYRIVNSFFSYYFMNKSVTQITDTTRNFMNKVIQDGISQGLGEDEIVRNLRNSEITDSRARLITRTETGRAMNTGAMLAAATSNFLMEKVWVSAQDNRTRRLPRDQYDHLHMNGKKVPFDGVFVVPSTETIDLMQYPSDAAGSAGNVCNCRCAILFVPKRNDAGDLMRIDINNPIQRNNIYRSIVLNNS
jgi:hypothetical protein